MSIPPALYDTLIAPALAWITALATSLLDGAAGLGRWATDHPVITVTVPLAYALVLIAINRLENSRRRP